MPLGALAGLGAAVVMAAAPAPAFSLTISPIHIKMPPGSYTELTVRDSGTRPIRVGVRVLALRAVAGQAGAWVPGGPAPYARAGGPASFTLRPGQARHVRVDVMAAAAPWHRDFAVLVRATQPGSASGHAAATVSAAGGAHIVVPGKPHPAARYRYVPPAIPAAPQHPFPWAFLALALAAIAAALVIIRRTRRRTTEGD